MTKQDITNAIINEMLPYLTANNVEKLKNAIIKNLHGYQIVEEETSISVVADDNDTYLKRFCIEMQITNLSETTIKQYCREARKFLDFSNKNFRDITYDDIIYYFAMLMQNKQISNIYLDTKRKHTKAFFAWAEKKDYITRNPFNQFEKIKYDKPIKEILSNEEIVLLRDSCETEIELALIDFLLSTGMRVSECAALNIDSVDFQAKKVKIYGKKTRKWRTAYLDASAIKHLAEYISSRDDDNEALFVCPQRPHGRIKKANIESITKSVAKKAGVKKKCTVHMFRRTLATRLYRKGMKLKDIANILGNSVATLEKYYIITDEAEIEANYTMCTA